MDVVIALTEALIAGIVKKTGNYKIIGTYVTSPLNWAVAVGKESKYHTLADLRGEKIGISRIGSGSQVMASYMALQQGWVDTKGKVEPINFEVLDTFKNLRDGVNDGRAAAFMWEHFTTKPFLNELRFIDHVLTPWSSWLLVATPTTLANPTILNGFLDNLTIAIQQFDSPQARAGPSRDFVVNEFDYPRKDVESWLETVTYPKGDIRDVKEHMVRQTLATLVQAGVLESPAAGWDMNNFVDPAYAELS